MSIRLYNRISGIPTVLTNVLPKACHPRVNQFLGNRQTLQMTSLLATCTKCQNSQILSRKPSTQHNFPTSHVPQLQYAHYGSGTLADDRNGVLSRMWKGLGFTGKLRYKKHVLQAAGLRMYLCCVELIDYPQFFEALELPDTFNSWFRITELHVWMCLVRLAQEQNEGKFVRNGLVRYMWEDVDKKSKKLGDKAVSSIRKQGIQMLSEQFRSALFAYDEGLLDSDIILAGALWRNLMSMKCDDPEKLEILVRYVRKQIVQLDQQDSAVILTSGLVDFAPLRGEPDKQRSKQIMQEIMKRV